MNQQPDIFDRIATHPIAQSARPLSDEDQKNEPPALVPQGMEGKDLSITDARTPSAVRKALQHLLGHGWLESASKPKLFSLIAAQTARLDALLEPLDLRVLVDDVRGLPFWPWCPATQATTPTRASRTTGRTH